MLQFDILGLTSFNTWIDPIGPGRSLRISRLVERVLPPRRFVKLKQVLGHREHTRRVAAQAKSGTGMSFDFTVQEPVQEAKEQHITKDNLTERRSQQSGHGDKGNSQKERQPQGQQLHRAEGRSAVATIKGSSPRLTTADSPGTAKTIQRKRRRKAKRRIETSGEQQNVNTLKQATEASGDREAAAIHPGEGQGKFAEAPQSEAHDSAAHAASAAGDVLQVRRGELGPSLQPALLHPGSPARQPYPVGQTVQLGSADSLAFLMGLGLSTQAASDTLSRILPSASDGRAGVQPKGISAWQVG